MKLWEGVDELWLLFKIVVIDFREPNARWKGCPHGIESILQRCC